MLRSASWAQTLSSECWVLVLVLALGLGLAGMLDRGYCPGSWNLDLVLATS